jgi:hypothetical protein
MATIINRVVEFFAGQAFDKISFLQPYKWTLIYVAAICGIGGCFLYGFDLLYLLGNYLAVELPSGVNLPKFAQPTWYGMLLTGFAVGMGAGFINDLMDKFFKPKVTETGAAG